MYIDILKLGFIKTCKASKALNNARDFFACNSRYVIVVSKKIQCVYEFFIVFDFLQFFGGLECPDNYRGIKIKDISDLKNPISFAEYHARGLKGMAHGIVVENEYIYYVKKGLTVLKFEKYLSKIDTTII